MNKIPVWRTVGRAYGFAFGHYLTVLGIVWLPLVIMTAASFFLVRPFYAQNLSGEKGGAMPFDPRLMRINLLVQLLALLVSTIMSVGIAKEVLGLRTGPRFFYLSFGAAEFRVLIGYFALILLFIVIVIGLAIAGGIAGGVAGVLASQVTSLPKPLVGLIVVAIVLAVFLAMIFIMVRLSFLFVPSTVAEHRIGIARSWELTHGNFWRIFAIGLMIFIPLIIIFCAVGFAILGAGYLDFAMQHTGDPAAVQAYVMHRLMPIMSNPVAIVVGLIVYPVFYGLTLSPPAFAYRALIPLPAEPAPVPETAPVTSDLDVPKELADVIEPEKPTER